MSSLTPHSALIILLPLLDQIKTYSDEYKMLFQGEYNERQDWLWKGISQVSRAYEKIIWGSLMPDSLCLWWCLRCVPNKNRTGELSNIQAWWHCWLCPRDPSMQVSQFQVKTSTASSLYLIVIIVIQRRSSNILQGPKKPVPIKFVMFSMIVVCSGGFC